MNEDQKHAPEPGPLSLPAGDYEVMVVDVEQDLDGDGDGNGESDAEISLVVLKGSFKGQVVGLRYPSAGDGLLGLLGNHGTLTATEVGLALRLED